MEKEKKSWKQKIWNPFKNLLNRSLKVAKSSWNFASSKFQKAPKETKEKPIKSKKNKTKKILFGNKPDEGVLLQRRILLICFFLVTSVVGFILGSLLSIPYTGVFAVSVASWLLFMFLPTAWKNSKTQYSGIEFLGRFYKTVGPGLRWRIPLFEKIFPDPYGELGKNQTVDIRHKEIKLYQPEENGKKKDETEDTGRKNVIDFKDISAPVDIRVYGRIGKDNSSEEQLFDAIYKWMYVMADVPSRVRETADSFFRPIWRERRPRKQKENEDRICGTLKRLEKKRIKQKRLLRRLVSI